MALMSDFTLFQMCKWGIGVYCFACNRRKILYAHACLTNTRSILFDPLLYLSELPVEGFAFANLLLFLFKKNDETKLICMNSKKAGFKFLFMFFIIAMISKICLI